MAITTILFDLDDTLYPARTGLWGDIKARISLYMNERLGIPADQVVALRQKYLDEYGTTLLGLIANYPLDVQEYLDFVHDLPLREYIQPDPCLRSILEALPARKFIFTNADRGHVGRVIDVLGLGGCFDGVVDILAMLPYCKPTPESFAMALERAGDADPRHCAMIDDMPRNTAAARRLGIYSILYGVGEPHPEADAVLTDWSLLPAILNGRS